MAFTFTGLFTLLGIAISLAGSGDTFLTNIAFGPTLFPCIAFLGRQDIDFDAVNVADPLLKLGCHLHCWGLFGTIGHLINQLLIKLNIPMDTIASSVAIGRIITRVVIGRDSIFKNRDDLEEARVSRTSNKDLIFELIWRISFTILTYFAV